MSRRNEPRHKSVASSSAQPNRRGSSRFVDEAAKIRFKELVKRKVIDDKGLLLTERHGRIQRIIDQHNWSTFCEAPKEINHTLLCEFVANLDPSNHDCIVTVRGKKVCYSSAIINVVYQTTSYDHDDDLYSLNIDWDVITGALCRTTGRELWNDKGTWFYQKYLTDVPKVWHQFVCCRLSPSSNESEVRKEQADIVFCICTGRSIDVGRIICNQIRQMQKGRNVIFGGLITRLCHDAGISTVTSDISNSTKKDLLMMSGKRKDPDSPPEEEEEEVAEGNNGDEEALPQNYPPSTFWDADDNMFYNEYLGQHHHQNLHKMERYFQAQTSQDRTPISPMQSPYGARQCFHLPLGRSDYPPGSPYYPGGVDPDL